MVILAAHQPDFLPFYRFFAKMAPATVFDLALWDGMTRHATVHHHRVKIGTDEQNTWLTLPARWSYGSRIIEVRLEHRQTPSWTRAWDLLAQTYKKFPRWAELEPALRDHFFPFESDLMWSYNVRWLTWLRAQLGITVPFGLAGIPEGKSTLERLVDMWSWYRPDIYISGNGEYLTGYEHVASHMYLDRVAQKGTRLLCQVVPTPRVAYYQQRDVAPFNTVSVLGLLLTRPTLLTAQDVKLSERPTSGSLVMA